MVRKRRGGRTKTMEKEARCCCGFQYRIGPIGWSQTVPPRVPLTQIYVGLCRWCSACCSLVSFHSRTLPRFGHFCVFVLRLLRVPSIFLKPMVTGDRYGFTYENRVGVTTLKIAISTTVYGSCSVNCLFNMSDRCFFFPSGFFYERIAASLPNVFSSLPVWHD